MSALDDLQEFSQMLVIETGIVSLRWRR